MPRKTVKTAAAKKENTPKHTHTHQEYTLKQKILVTILLCAALFVSCDLQQSDRFNERVNTQVEEVLDGIDISLVQSTRTMALNAANIRIHENGARTIYVGVRNNKLDDATFIVSTDCYGPEQLDEDFMPAQQLIVKGQRVGTTSMQFNARNLSKAFYTCDFYAESDLGDKYRDTLLVKVI